MEELEALFAAGAAALEAQDLAGAERQFRAIVNANPAVHAGWNALSVVAIRSGQPQIAVEHARRALELDRRNALYLNNLGVAQGELGRLAEAEATFRRALQQKPVYPEGLFNLGKVLHKQGRPADALRAFERGHAMEPGFPGMRLSLAQMHWLLGRAERALEVLREGAGLDERAAPFHAAFLADAEGIGSAIAWMRSAAGQYRSLHYPLALALLSAAQWRDGWRHYASRQTIPVDPQMHRAALPARLDGKRVLLRAEQGLGDVLFFLRFLPQLRERGAVVALECPAALTSVISLPEPGDADLRLWIGDLPALLEVEGTAAPCVLKCDDAEPARARLATLGPPPYLALTWRAGTDVLRQQEYGNPQDLLSKEVPRRMLGAALRGWPGTLVALQRKPAAGELDELGAAAGARVHDFSALNDDLRAMLAMLAVLDEYVTVSNTNVHLIAGLGKRARVLVPHPAEWRWMHEGDQSPWFPGFPIYRQPRSRDWSEPLARLRRDLRLS